MTKLGIAKWITIGRPCRLLGLAAALAIAELSDRSLVFCWKSDNACPCEYRDLFEDDFRVLSPEIMESPDLNATAWDPVDFWKRYNQSLLRNY